MGGSELIFGRVETLTLSLSDVGRLRGRLRWRLLKRVEDFSDGDCEMIGEMPQTRVKLPVLKIKAGMRVDVVIASEQVLGFVVHWLGGRSYMCPGDECEACAQHLGGRWNGFFVVRVKLPEGRRVALLEVSPGSFDRLAGLCRMEGRSTYAGMRCICSRSKARAPLVIDPVDVTGEEESPLVSSFRAWEAVSTLYQLPALAPGETLGAWEARAIPAARRLVELACRRLDS